jgi:hypothetical protein
LATAPLPIQTPTGRSGQLPEKSALRSPITFPEGVPGVDFTVVKGELLDERSPLQPSQPIVLSWPPQQAGHFVTQELVRGKH